MRVHVIAERCQGHAMCTLACPDIFLLTEDGHAHVAVETVPKNEEEQVLQAQRSCPEDAIVVQQDEEQA